MERVILVAFRGAQSLDIFGPAEVFSGARARNGTPFYEVVLTAPGDGLLQTSSRLTISARPLSRIQPAAKDTVLVAGGAEDGIRSALKNIELTRWIKKASSMVRRVGSVCSGAFVLAGAGVLDGRRAATHWSACAHLSAFRPEIHVDANAIFVQDGHVWTSAGVTTGIDMALAMVEQDHGRQVADSIAARLVLHARRLGFHSQFSEALIAQAAGSAPLAPVIEWARSHIQEAMDTTRLAQENGMSVRTLYRRCADQAHCTPAKLIEQVRIEHARLLLSTTKLGMKTLALRCGFGSAARMTRGFRRLLGVTPGEYRLRNSPSGPNPSFRSNNFRE